MKLTLTKAHIQDIEEISDLEKDCFSDPWTYGMFRDSMENETVTFFIVRSDDPDKRLIAYAGIGICGDQSDIINFAVKPDNRRNGIATFIIDYLIQFAEISAVKDIFLEVRESNIPARQLYIKSGFRDSGIRKNYYKDPVENAIVMTKHIEIQGE